MDRVYLDHQVNTFKIDNAMVYQILSVFTNTDTYVYRKQRKATQDGQALYFNIYKRFIGPDHVAMQAVDSEEKILNFHYDGNRKMWSWDKYVALHKEQHTIMESLAEYSTVAWTMTPKSATFFKASRALSWRQ